MTKKIIHDFNQTDFEAKRRERLFNLYEECPIPKEELLSNLGLFISKTEFSRILYMHELYKKILDVHGMIMEFGVRWGHNLALFETFRGIYEPFNSNRKIVGFDTFEGFPSIAKEDGSSELASVGAFSVTDKYEEYLNSLLSIHGEEGALPNKEKFELVKGDASNNIEKYLSDHPETIISLAYFDFDIYEPTKKCLEAIKGHITKGSILAFDELNYDKFPGETIALKEVFGLDNCRLVHTPYSSARAYFIFE
jgi:hypothetical protein